ncbi:MAG: hypothetical protein Q9166_002481 [cf. Caloplaca sp. 2 TL-2023]
MAHYIQEAYEGKITLPDDDADAFERMLTYIYTSKFDDVDPTDVEKGSTTPEAEIPNVVATDSNDLSSATSSVVSREIDEACKAPVHVMLSALMNNVLVYALAEKYDVRLLKELAQTKFEIRASDEWAMEDITTVMSKVYETTPSTDRGLRNAMLGVCLRYEDGLMRDENFLGMLNGDATMCFDVLLEVQQKSKRLSVLLSSVQDKAAKFESIKEWVKTEERLLKDIILENTFCRSCAQRLDLSISNGSAAGWKQPIIIKCRNCRHRYIGS